MRVSLDGGLTWQPTDGVVMEYDVTLVDDDGEDFEAQLLVNCTTEGIILDVTELGEVLSTAGYTADDLAELCH